MTYRKKFIMGDIHGAYRALQQCVDRCGFNQATDLLIQLGDVADGWPHVYECVEYLRSLPNLIAIQGNHDQWTLDFMSKGFHTMAQYHYTQGGQATLTSYAGKTVQERDKHFSFFRSQQLYHKDDDGNVFVHGGFNAHLYLNANKPDTFLWDRDLYLTAMKRHRAGIDRLVTLEQVNEIFVGHTQTKDTTPAHLCNLWNLDTGAGWNGKLTIMDLETKAYWQSDNVLDLYPGVSGRLKMK